MVSYSDNLTKIALGLSKNKQYEPIFNLLYFYSPKSYLPAYYRLFNGNIKDVTMLCIAIKESGYNNAIIIGDKGFFSEENLLLLETQKLHYIVPLRLQLKKSASFTTTSAEFFELGKITFERFSEPSHTNILVSLPNFSSFDKTSHG
jgi:transposase